MVDFDTLEAGRETNDLVAVCVMGWHPVWVRSRKGSHGGSFIGGHYESELACLTDCGDEYEPLMLWADEREFTFGKHEHNWNPSTNIKAAWEVVEKFPAIVIQRASSPDGSKVGYRCSLPLEPNNPRRSGQSVTSIDADADTAPLAICRVALKAMQSASAQAAS